MDNEELKKRIEDYIKYYLPDKFAKEEYSSTASEITYFIQENFVPKEQINKIQRYDWDVAGMDESEDGFWILKDDLV